MLLRVTSLDGLLILHWFPSSKILQGLLGELQEELSRIKKLNQLMAAQFDQVGKEAP
jgi:hypothetical protein